MATTIYCTESSSRFSKIPRTGPLARLQRAVGWFASSGLPILTKVILFFSFIRNSRGAELSVARPTPLDVYLTVSTVFYSSFWLRFLAGATCILVFLFLLFIGYHLAAFRLIRFCGIDYGSICPRNFFIPRNPRSSMLFMFFLSMLPSVKASGDYTIALSLSETLFRFIIALISYVLWYGIMFLLGMGLVYQGSSFLQSTTLRLYNRRLSDCRVKFIIAIMHWGDHLIDVQCVAYCFRTVAYEEVMTELSVRYNEKALLGWFEPLESDEFKECAESALVPLYDHMDEYREMYPELVQNYVRTYLEHKIRLRLFSGHVDKVVPPEPNSVLKTPYHRCLRALLVMQGIEPNPGWDCDKSQTLLRLYDVKQNIRLTMGQLKKTLSTLELFEYELSRELDKSFTTTTSPSIAEVVRVDTARFGEDDINKLMTVMLETCRKAVAEAEADGKPELVADLKAAIDGVVKPQMMGLAVPVNVGISVESREFVANALKSLQELMPVIPDKIDIHTTNDFRLPQLESFFSHFGFPSTKSPLAKVLAVCAIAGINYASYHSTMTPWAKLIVAALTTGAGIWFIADNEFFSFLLELKAMMPFCDEPNAVETQAGADFLGKEGFIALICGGVYYSVFNRRAPTGLATEFLKKTSDLSRLKTGVETGFDLVMTVVYKFMSFLGDMTGNEDWKYLDIQDATLLALTKELNAVIALMNETGEHGFENHNILMSLDGRIRTFQETLGDKKTNQMEITACRSLLATIHQLLPLFVCGNKFGSRLEPTGVCLHGRPNQGKTVILPNLVSAIAARVLNDVQWARYDNDPVGSTYYFYGEQEFQEGLDASKLIMVIDELGQRVDSAANPNPEVFSVIRAINTNPWSANMANAHLKGKVVAKFEFVLATTNCKKWNFPSIVEVDAFGRRFPCEYWVCVQRRYATPESLLKDNGTENSFMFREPNWSLVKPDENGFPELDYCDFIPFSGVTGKVKPGTSVLNLDEVIDQVDQLHKSRKLFSDKNLESHVAFRKKMSAQRKAGEFEKLCTTLAEPLPVPEVKPIGKPNKLPVKPQMGKDDIESLNNADPKFYDHDEIVEFCRIIGINSGLAKPCLALLPAQRNLPYWDQCLLVKEEFHKYQVRPLTTKVFEYLRGLYDSMTKHPIVSSVLLGMTSAMLLWQFLKPSIIDQSYKVKNVVTKHSNKAVPRVAVHQWTIHPPFVDAQASRINQNTNDICQVVNRKSKFIVTLRNYMEGLEGDELSVQVGPTFGGALFFGGQVCWMPSHYRDRILSPNGALPSYADAYPNLVVRFSRVTGGKPWYFEVLWRELNEDNGHKNFMWTGPNEDQMFVRLPSACPRMKNILAFIPSEKETFWNGNFNGALMRANPSGGFNLCPALMGVVNDQKYADYLGVKMITYSIDTLFGECGSPVFVTDNRVTKPWLCGMHAAGDTRTVGYALPLVREDFEFALRYFGEAPTDELVAEGGSDEVKEDKPVLPQGGFVHYSSCIGPALPVSQASKTQITRAPLHGIFGEVMTAPARLTSGMLDGMFVSPLEKSISKNCNPRPAFNSKLLRQATLQTSKKIYSVVANDDPAPLPEVWDKYHAIEGDPEFNPITRSTSAGYPWNLRHDRKKKRDFLGHDEYVYTGTACQELFRVVDKKLALLLQGIDPGFVFVTNLKDETRPLHKVASFSTRSTEAEPIDLTILTRMFFGDWMKFMHKTKIKTGVCVGINPYAQDWSILANMLSSYGDRMIAGDHSQWDGNFPIVLWYELLVIIEQYYYNSTAEERLARKTIIDILANSKHLVVTRDDWWKLVSADTFRELASEEQKEAVEQFLFDVNLPSVLRTSYEDLEQSKIDYIQAFIRNLKPGALKAFIIEWFGSLVSGGTLTSLAGSVGNQVISRYAAYDHVLKPKGGHLSYERWEDVPFDEIEKDNGFFTFGDDNVISVGPKQFFNFADLKESFRHYRMNYTNTKKTAEEHEYERLAEIEFLQRGFVKDKVRAVWMSPLGEISIQEMVNWIKQSARPGDYERNIRSAILEYSQHGFDKFTEKCTNLLIPAAAEKLNLRFPELTYDNARDELSRCDAYHR